MSGRELLAVAYDDVMGTVTQASPTGALTFTYDSGYDGGLPLDSDRRLRHFAPLEVPCPDP